jgi:putative NADPH-quinone reductase
MSFDPILRDGFRKGAAARTPICAPHMNSWASCDHLVLIFPLWCGDMPALLKGFIERILQPDLIARQDTDTAMNWNIFANKTARIIMTMGMPVSIYRWWYGGHALKLLTRNILHFIGIKPVRHTLYGMIGTSKPARARALAARDRSIGESRQVRPVRCIARHGSGQYVGHSRCWG